MKITKERMREIEQITTNILSEHNVDLSKSPYIDIVSIVKQDGFKVEPKFMPIDTTGCILINDSLQDKERTIIVNKIFKNPDNEDDVIFKKSRFITAHEYGHYILHKDSGNLFYAHRDSDNRNSKEEIEADYFSSALLMPADRFISSYNILKHFGDNDNNFVIYSLSTLFKVTKNKINKRIDDLNVLNG